MMKVFIQGVDRQQATLLPEYLDDWVDTRAILYVRSMCLSMRWNCANWVLMASPRQ
jgi:hypothetical protein